ncbi:MAG TPA: ADP-ribosylation factor-like protein [Anaeromyxobacteraceae bacterium]|nr:ADP-ribosylation factor-like protein [Anaeromyxobacteraceae bacterium]
MSIINPLSREISAKIVYYGPAMSGKTTSLRHVYKAVREQSRGELISLSTEGDRTLFFDFLPVKIEHVRGLKIRLQLYTVPGQVFYDATRKLVLNGADGVVFVADSQPQARDSNLESMENLGTNLAELGIDLARFPLVVQYNKRDLPGAMPLEQMRSDLNGGGAPELETVASRGDNVMAALREITRLVVVDLKARQPQRPAAPAPPAGAVPEGIAHELEAAAEAVPTPAPGVALPRPDRGARLDLSLARLFPGAGTEVADVEMAIRDRTYGLAVRSAAQAVAELLQSLPVSDEAPTARAALLGLDGAEYLRLCRLAGKPDQGLGEREALFALYVLVAARVKAERLGS